jgi:hypothetical protein
MSQERPTSQDNSLWAASDSAKAVETALSSPKILAVSKDGSIFVSDKNSPWREHTPSEGSASGK